MTPENTFQEYALNFNSALSRIDWHAVQKLADILLECWQDGMQVFLCGNGGSAANAMHLANDFLYGIAKEGGTGLKAHALAANTSILTCLANDTEYASIYSAQLETFADANDILIVLSGSGQSDNVVQAIKKGMDIGMHTVAITAFDGGACKQLADLSIHFPVFNMQIAEDLQMVVGHALMLWLQQHNPIFTQTHHVG